MTANEKTTNRQVIQRRVPGQIEHWTRWMAHMRIQRKETGRRIQDDLRSVMFFRWVRQFAVRDIIRILARYKQRAAAEVTKFREQHSNFLLPDQQVATFSLFSSTLVNDAPVYRCEQSDPLLV